MPSTVVSNIDYNSEARILIITYTSGVKYEYMNVPHEVYEQLSASKSKGIFLNQHIKRKSA
jgi:hypothetical protein